ncbi:MAG: hypothetical protein PQJ46_17770, partial [Spirochaetales bacterium]|nr:hypothetical protein [Spirochaetales bacterium]
MNRNDDLLGNVINETEDIFSRIASSYPILLKELDTGIGTALDSIKGHSFLEQVSVQGSQENLGFGDYLEYCKKDFSERLEKLSTYRSKNNALLSELATVMDNYLQSQGYQEEIRDISEALQVVSLNALCNAVKAGRGGEGFSIITESLKTVSVEAIDKTKSLASKSELIKASFKEFSSIEAEIN